MLRRSRVGWWVLSGVDVDGVNVNESGLEGTNYKLLITVHVSIKYFNAVGVLERR